MSKLSNIASSILKLSTIFGDLNGIAKMADESDGGSQGQPGDQPKRRRIVNQDQPRETEAKVEGAEGKEADVISLLGGRKQQKQPPAKKVTLTEVDLLKDAVIADTAAKLLEFDSAEFETKRNLIQSLLDYFIKFKDVAFVKNLPRAQDPRTKTIITGNIQKIDDFIKKLYTLKLIYDKVVLEKLGLSNLVNELRYYAVDDVEIIPFGDENLKDQCTKAAEIIGKSLDYLRRIHGTTVTNNNFRNILKDLGAQGYDVEKNVELESKIKEGKSLKSEELEKVDGLVSEESKKAKTKQLLEPLYAQVSDLSDYKSEDEIESMFSDLVTAQQDLMSSTGEEGGVSFSGKVQTLLLSFVQKMNTIVNNNDERIQQCELRIKAIDEKISSSADPEKRKKLEQSKKYEEKKLAIFQEKVKKNLEAREQVSKLCDAYQEELDRLMLLLKDPENKNRIQEIKGKIQEFGEKIRSIANLQKNLLAVARYQDYINPFKAEEKVKIDEKQLSKITEYVEGSSGAESLFQYQIEELRYHYINFKSKPTSYPGKDASKFKEQFPQWLELIQKTDSLPSLLVYFGEDSEAGRVRDLILSEIKDFEQAKSEMMALANQAETNPELQGEVQDRVAKLQEKKSVIDNHKVYAIREIFIKNLEHFNNLISLIREAHEAWKSKEGDRQKALSEVELVSRRANSLLLSGGGDVNKIKAELEDILSDPNKAKHLQGRMYQSIIGTIRSIIENAESGGQSDSNVKQKLELMNAAVQQLIAHFSSTSTAINRQFVQQIAAMIQSRSANPEYIRGLLNLLVEKISDSGALEKIKREIFVELYLKEAKIAEIGGIYEDKKVSAAHKKGMRDFIDKIAGREATYADFLEGKKMDTRLLIEEIGKLSQADIKQYFPIGADSITRSKAQSDVLKSLRFVDKKVREFLASDMLLSDPTIIKRVFNQDDFKLEIDNIKRYLDSCGKARGAYITNLEKLLAQYQKISEQTLTSTKVEEAPTPTPSQIMQSTPSTGSVTFSPPPKEKTYFGNIIATCIKNFTTAAANSDIEALNKVIEYIDKTKDNDQILNREKELFLSHARSQGAEDSQAESYFTRWIANMQKLLEQLKTNCSNKVRDIENK